MEPVTWIDKCELFVEGPVVRVISTSGVKEYTCCMSRAAVRQYLEHGIRTLNAAEIRERSGVVAFRAR